MNTDVFVIHGGDTFQTHEEYIAFLKRHPIDREYLRKKGWKAGLQQELGETCEVFTPAMPNKFNARYVEWKIWFEKMIPLMHDDVILIGHSLGGLFLAKYLSEETLQKKVLATMLVAAPYNSTSILFSTTEEPSLTDFVLQDNLERLAKQGGRIFLYQSEDDMVVPVSSVEYYRNALPNAQVAIFKDRGHFSASSFSEIVRDIQEIIR